MSDRRRCLARLALGIAVCFLAVLPPALAEEFYCEVMAMEGTATVSNDSVSGKSLQEGDLLKVEDTVEVAADSYVDLAYDREWNNVTRIEENTKINIRSIYPTTLELDSGGVYAKLKQLPKESSFDVQTPTAIASVRGTEYRTTYLEGETQIYNVSNSDVYVYGLDDSGQKQSEPVVLKNSEKTQVQKRGLPPIPPRPMETHDFKPVEHAREKIEGRIHDNIAKGRMGKIQDIKQMENSGPPGGAREGRMEKSGGGALTSMEGGRKPERQPVKTMNGEEARQAAEHAVGEKGSPGEKGRGQDSDRSGDGRRESNGQPFGPDPGRRPQDGDFKSQKQGQGPQNAQKQPSQRQAPKAQPRQNHT